MKTAIALLYAGSLFVARNRHVEQGNQLFAEGKLAEALAEYERAASTLPEEPGVRFNRGAALYGLGKYDEAQKEFLRATEAHDPQLKESAFYNMGNAFFRMKRYQDAVDAYKRALGTDPRDLRAKWNLEMALKELKEEEQKQKQQSQNDQNQNQKKDQDKDRQQKEQQQKEEQQRAEKERQEKREQQARERPPEPKQQPEPQPPDKAPDKAIDKQDAEAVLDALERGEKNLELEQAKIRARGRRRPNKDY